MWLHRDAMPPDYFLIHHTAVAALPHNGSRAQKATRLARILGVVQVPIRMSSVSEKMQRELTQVESQIYDLETIFLSTNRYGQLLATHSTDNAAETALPDHPSSPSTPTKISPTISNADRIFSNASMTSNSNEKV
jgi:hypothetical protein